VIAKGEKWEQIGVVFLPKRVSSRCVEKLQTKELPHGAERDRLMADGVMVGIKQVVEFD